MYSEEYKRDIIKTFQDDIDILAWSWGLTNSSTATGIGSGTGTVALGDIKVIKSIDAATPNLLEAVATGDSFATASIHSTVPDGKGGEVDIVRLELTNVVVTKLTHGGKDTEDGVAETLNLNFGKVHLKYFSAAKDGTTVAKGDYCWDVAQNTKC